MASFCYTELKCPQTDFEVGREEINDLVISTLTFLIERILLDLSREGKSHEQVRRLCVIVYLVDKELGVVVREWLMLKAIPSA